MSVYKGTTLIAGIPDISGKANIDMNNLTSTGKNIGNWSSNVTNCITYIPQDISLTLSSGTLTLKAGSKSYMPNGTGVFTEVTNSVDLTYTPTWGAGYQCFITGYVNSNGTLSGIGMCRADLQYSGSTSPAATINGSLWYDTSANKIKVYRSGAWVVDSTSEPRTLFLGIVTVGTGNVITSIDQVFNGFGYIGSTMFALPDVKGLIPDGRNEDGTLKNTEITLSNVITYTFSNYNSYGMWLGISSTEIMANNRFVSQEENPQTTYTTWYKPSENISYYSSGTTTFSKLNYVVFGQIDRTAGSSMPTLSNFKHKKVFQVLDYNDKSTIVGWGMPDYNTNVNITSLIPTSGSYKFSEKCFVFVRCVKESNSNATATLKINGVSYDICWTSANNQWREQNNFLLPIDVNDTLAHNTVGTWTFIKFSMKGIQ